MVAYLLFAIASDLEGSIHQMNPEEPLKNQSRSKANKFLPAVIVRKKTLKMTIVRIRLTSSFSFFHAVIISFLRITKEEKK